MTDDPREAPADRVGRGGRGGGDDAARPDPRMLEALVCPRTQQRLEWDAEAGELIARRAGLAYPVRDGIPIMLVTEARRL
ncbi:hypothetical protein BCF33_1625 [Hasllibacter halocynthiae]|uniref:UPF0434 protein BCF33_1625 n=1 Tax=Hasllibacter halocynthiae TaxID=595589 RepID=A0A2T0X1F7_9RHOB|nr:hypothetical protein BCF33_1625 [Hasllibacter halocynthiae]